MIDLIAFLGTTDYKPTVYWTDDFELKTKFVQIASAARIEGLSRLTILATKKARETHEVGFKEEWENLPRKAEWAGVELIFQTVPDGHNFEEAVGIFKEIADKLDHDSEVYFDITHGFRSQPLIGLLALQYLEAQRQDLSIKDVSYGVYVPGEPDHPDNGRLVSLADFLTIKDWAYGTRVFRETGSVTGLVQLSNKTHRDAARAGYRGSLGGLVRALEQWGKFVESGAVERVVTQSATVMERLNQFREDEVGASIGPFFTPLLDQISKVIEPLIADSATSDEGLQAQLSLLEWIFAIGRYQLALVIAREWFVSLVEREVDPAEVEREAALAANLRRTFTARDLAALTLNRLHMEETNRGQTWSKLMNIRNKFSHAWMGHPVSNDPMNEAARVMETTLLHFRDELLMDSTQTEESPDTQQD